MKATITVEMDNAAFEDNGPALELALILKGFANRIERNGLGQEYTLRDTNGNTVGKVVID